MPTTQAATPASLEIEALDGKESRSTCLTAAGTTCGWINAFKREGIDKMLANGEIAPFISTHEHMDHYFGFPVVAKYGPNVTVYRPSTFYPAGKDYMVRSGRVGKVIDVTKGLHKIQEGVALCQFECR
ncbi:MAG: hypothetical protein ACLSE8_14415 [Parasutterella sp.]